MKKIMIYLLATALACGLVVSLGYAQAPPALENAPPFVLPAPPHIADLVGCWVMELIVNPFLTNEAIKIPTDDLLNQAYMEIDSMDVTWIYGKLHIKKAGSTKTYAGEGTISGLIVSLFANYTDPFTYLEERRYLTGTLTKDEIGRPVIYGMGITSTEISTTTKHYLNQIGSFKAIRIRSETQNCSPP